MDTPKIAKVMLEIERGGFGIIERVRLENGQEAAKKTFKPKNIDSLEKTVLDKLRQRFIKEVMTQAQLPKDSVIPIIGYDLSGDHPWYLMPLASRVYSDEIETAKWENRAPEGLSDILNAMEVIHGLGYKHRDIKPQNILLHDGRWKLSDFGLISTDTSILSKFSTSTGDKGGTELYMAPEQYSDFKHVTPQADIYSFGAILHDIFNGEPRTPYGELDAPGDMGFIIQKRTKKNPRNRFPSIPALRSALLTTLEKYGKDVPTEDEAEWIKKLESYLEWNEEDLERFCFGVDRLEDKRAVFMELNKDRFSQFAIIDTILWGGLVSSYLEWINNTAFHYDYCDVLIGRILSIYDLTMNIDIKAQCVLAAAELGAYHNRWYVMHRVVRMANRDIEENLAQRLAIEFQIDSKAKVQFEKCIHEISLQTDQCHPIIAQLFRA